MATNKENMLAGKLYLAGGEELAKEAKKSRMLTRLFNNTTEEQIDYRTQGSNIKVGNNFNANFDCIILVIPKVTIGDNVIAVGNPCRVLREITDEDKQYWEHLKDEYYRDIEQ